MHQKIDLMNLQSVIVTKVASYLKPHSDKTQNLI